MNGYDGNIIKSKLLLFWLHINFSAQDYEIHTRTY